MGVELTEGQTSPIFAVRLRWPCLEEVEELQSLSDAPFNIYTKTKTNRTCNIG